MPHREENGTSKRQARAWGPSLGQQGVSLQSGGTAEAAPSLLAGRWTAFRSHQKVPPPPLHAQAALEGPWLPISLQEHVGEHRSLPQPTSLGRMMRGEELPHHPLSQTHTHTQHTHWHLSPRDFTASTSETQGSPLCARHGSGHWGLQEWKRQPRSLPLWFSHSREGVTDQKVTNESSSGHDEITTGVESVGWVGQFRWGHQRKSP